MARKESITTDILEGWGSIEVWVTYQVTEDFFDEECHGIHRWIEVSIDISCVEISIAGELMKVADKTNFLPYLTKKQIEKIESLLPIND